MKKLATLLLILLISVSLCACGALDAGNWTMTGTNKPNLDESLQLDDFDVSANKIQISDGDSFFTPAEGNIFVSVDMKIKNTSDEEVFLTNLNFFECYVDDAYTDPSLDAGMTFDGGTLFHTVAPDKEISFQYSVECPADSKVIQFKIKSKWAGDSKDAALSIDIPSA